MGSEINVTLEVLHLLRNKFDPYLSDSVRDSQLFVDLADIYEICCSYIKVIDGINNMDITDKNATEDVLYEIDNQLFEHLPHHLESLKVLLPKLIDLFDENNNEQT